MKRGRKAIVQYDTQIQCLAASGSNIPEIAENLLISTHIVRSALKRLEIQPSRHRGARSPDRDQAITKMVSDGKTQKEIALELGVTPGSISQRVRKLNLDPKKGWVEHDQCRTDAMAALYKAGITLQEIGDQYGLTRERVRQILAKRTHVTAKDGGRTIRAEKARQSRATKQDQKYMARLGIDFTEYKRMRELGREAIAAGGSVYKSPLRAFIQQRGNAGRRGIGWELKFWEWWKIWQDSGHWDERGKGQGYVMCRRGDEGPYALGNVFIDTAAANSSKQKRKKSDLPMGVIQQGRRYVAKRMFGGKMQHLGSFETPLQAYAAYLSASAS